MEKGSICAALGIEAVVYANSIFVAVAMNGTILLSDDGETWEKISGLEGPSVVLEML
jgi:hypothetical protein